MGAADGGVTFGKLEEGAAADEATESKTIFESKYSSSDIPEAGLPLLLLFVEKVLVVAFDVLVPP